MAFIDNMMNKITSAGQSTVQKAKGLSEVAKLNLTVSETEKQVNELYNKIGYEICCAYLDNPIPEVAELLEQVKDLHRKIDDCKEQIKSINAANACPQCGAKIVKGSVFCSECGFKFPEPEQPAVPQASFCANCGAAVSDGAAFCTGCGTKVN